MSKWIDADALKEAMGEEPYVWTDSAEEIAERNQWLTDMHIIENAPSIDIVRCQDCKYWVYHFNGCSRNPCTEPWYATDFCNYGEREGE